ncbi:hypothetical protein ACWKSR_11010, partial [Campylobacter fetus subsp. venerealis]
DQQGNNEKDVPKVAASQQIREATAEVYSYLEDLKQQLITQSNAKGDDGVYLNSSLKNTEIAGNIFANQGKGEEMKARLNSYPQQISEIMASAGVPELTFA